MAVIGRQPAAAPISQSEIVQGTGATKIAAGTTAQRPGTPTTDMIRKNTTTGYLEYYDPSTGEWLGIGAFQASGGNSVTDAGGYRYHTFTSSGTFTVSSGAKNVAYLVVAGGGSGGGHYNGNYEGGGGGAGGYISATLTATPGNYSVVVGGGGAGAVGLGNTPGSNSSVFSSTAIGEIGRAHV